MKYHVLIVFGTADDGHSSIEAIPCDDEAARDAKALSANEATDSHDSVYWLDVSDKGEVKVGIFPSAFFGTPGE